MHASIEVKGPLGRHAPFVALGMKHWCNKQSNDAKEWESTTSLARMEATSPQCSPGPSHFTRLSPQTGLSANLVTPSLVGLYPPTSTAKTAQVLSKEPMRPRCGRRRTRRGIATTFEVGRGRIFNGASAHPTRGRTSSPEHPHYTLSSLASRARST